MKERNKGFTLIELITTVFVIAILTAGVIGFGSLFVRDSSAEAVEQTMKKFPGFMQNQVEITGVTCDKWDTDNNGRVRCTVTYMKAGNRDINDISTDVWECPWGLTLASSCVPVKYGTR